MIFEQQIVHMWKSTKIRRELGYEYVLPLWCDDGNVLSPS
jgi:hypothetical protein